MDGAARRRTGSRSAAPLGVGRDGEAIFLFWKVLEVEAKPAAGAEAAKPPGEGGEDMLNFMHQSYKKLISAAAQKTRAEA